ncbi:unnamed protein product [Wuchereria bancrofti]|uniref:Uncharacterized protein n=1 Tax=Wuchereria bancrofti TaxID=6293 RepID=A0A3P7DW85_WUCBA|nr:unnamed protein product [Wuchereria bancrofti]
MEDSVFLSTPVNATAAVTVPHKMGPVKLLKRSARRCLFGRPDPQNVDQWLTEDCRPFVQAFTGVEISFENARLVYKVPQFYRSSYYLSSRCTPSETENCMPCSSVENNNCNVDSLATSVSSDCSGPEIPVLPVTSSLTKCKERRIAKKQTKLTAFMNVDSRKRLRQQTQKAPSSPKSIRLIGHCRSFI